jgi:anthraniloyl-CoA monooxygenase
VKIVCVGAGPAGLYFASSLKRRDRSHDIAVLERNRRGETYGWGVVFWDDMLDNLYANDAESAHEIRAASRRWDEQEVRVGGKGTTYLGGYGYSMGREHLLDLLAERAAGLGADVRWEHGVEHLSELDDADLIVGCDGVNSQVREHDVERFGTEVETGRNKYIWLGTHKVFDAFTFAFEQTAAGWIWAHAYGFDGETSTFIVECSPETWQGLGFDALGPDETSARLEEIFGAHLDGHPLLSRAQRHGRAPWLNFRRLRNERWFHDNVVLMGDAAHTTHFTIGSGTKLALEDAIGLARSLHEHADLGVALQAYEQDRRAAVLPLQREARRSAQWFEDIPRQIDQDALRFAYSLVRRRGDAGHAVEAHWRHQLHQGTQRSSALRKLRRWRNSARRELHALRRAAHSR